MSLKHRNALVEKIHETQPPLDILSDQPKSILRGSWGLLSYSFQLGFEALWDSAKAEKNGLLERPLLNLWRQSIELALKSAIENIEGNLKGTNGHNLEELFQKLVMISTKAGLSQDDALTRNVGKMIEHAQSFDTRADRFRYPEPIKGDAYQGINVDLDKLFQAHWIITTWCEGTGVELAEKFGIGRP